MTLRYMRYGQTYEFLLSDCYEGLIIQVGLQVDLRVDQIIPLWLRGEDFKNQGVGLGRLYL